MRCVQRSPLPWVHEPSCEKDPLGNLKSQRIVVLMVNLRLLPLLCLLEQLSFLYFHFLHWECFWLQQIGTGEVWALQDGFPPSSCSFRYFTKFNISHSESAGSRSRGTRQPFPSCRTGWRQMSICVSSSRTQTCLKKTEGVLSELLLVRNLEANSSWDRRRRPLLRWPLLHPASSGANILTDLTPGEDRNDVLQVQWKGGWGEHCMNSSMRVLRKVPSWGCVHSI